MAQALSTGEALRIVSAAVAALFVAFFPLDGVAGQRSVGKALVQTLAGGDVRHGAPPLPGELAETTRFVKAYREEDGALTYRYEVTGPGLDADRIQAFVKETLRPQLYFAWCADERLSYDSMDTWYEYVDQQGNLLAQTLVLASKSSCRKWWKLEKDQAQ